MPRSEFVFRYRVRNWSEYNRALIRRGQLTLWFDEAAIAAWRQAGHTGRRGRPCVYADTAIECALVMKSLFHLSLRATQGFLESITAMLKLELPVPDYTTVSRRQGTLRVSLRLQGRARHVVVDATGLKVYGAGEWHAGKYPRHRRRTWRKLHVGVDATSKEIVAMDITTSRVHDSRQLPTLLSQVGDEIAQVSGDRGYDTGRCYESVLKRGAVATIVPRRNARVSPEADPPPSRAARDSNLRAIQSQGRYDWRRSSGYTRQSLAENAMSRFKTVFGGHLSARTFLNQQVEAAIKCAVLNRMAALGLPRSERVL